MGPISRQRDRERELEMRSEIRREGGRKRVKD